MSTINIARNFHPICVLLLCFWVFLFQLILRMDMGLLEKVFFLIIVAAMQLTLITFEAYRIEKSEESEWHV